MRLEELGFSDWFQQQAKHLKIGHKDVARVLAVDKERYQIASEGGEMSAEVRGRMIHGAASNVDLPTVGDWVRAEFLDDGTFAVIHEVLPRKSVLKRKVAGKRIEYQLLAANIDVAFIVQSLDFDFNLARLDRYMVMVHDGGITPVILLSKLDLITPAALEQRMLEIETDHPGFVTVPFSAVTEEGIAEIESVIRPGTTCCLIGSSGVGKTSLLNKLLGRDVFATRAVREKDSRGRHATTRRQLVVLENGAVFVDTPGMRELANIGVETGLKETFSDIHLLSENCRFRNCSHTDEPGCAILDAVDRGVLSARRHENFVKIRRESDHYERSYLEKRRRDKQFGKMYKDIIKSKKKGMR